MSPRTQPSSRRRHSASRAFRVTSWIALIAFHAVLLGGRLHDASILEPSVLARWGGALALLLTAFLFQRFAPARLRGRRSFIIFWLLAAFLHFIGPLQQAGHDLDLELTLGFGVSLLAFAHLFAVASRLMANACRHQMRRSLLLHLAAARWAAAPRGPPLRVF